MSLSRRVTSDMARLCAAARAMQAREEWMVKCGTRGPAEAVFCRSNWLEEGLRAPPANSPLKTLPVRGS
jgi:hypothetical protein